MRLNLSFRLIILLALVVDTRAMNIEEVPKEMREPFVNFLSLNFDESKALSEWSHVKNGKRIYHLKYPDDMDSPKFIGYAHKKNTQVFHAARTKEEVLFRSQYRFNKRRRREVGLEKRDEQEKHLIIAGCSFALGTSLNDFDTAAFHMARLSKEHYPVNLSVAGSGTNTMLAMVRHNLTQESLDQKEGVFVYFYLDFHIPRANGFAMERQWLWDTPHYQKTDTGEMIYKGNFRESEPSWTKFYEIAQKALKGLGILFNFPKLSSKHIQYTCDLIQATKKNYLSKFPKGDFVVYAHPYSPPNTELIKCLDQAKVKTLISELVWSKEDVIKYDDHPNGAANRKIARELVDKLDL